MPIMQCTLNGKPGYKYGNSGECYTYKQGNKRSKQVALNKANAQRKAILSSGYKE